MSRLKIKPRKVGEFIHTSMGRDEFGRFWWAEGRVSVTGRPKRSDMHGPFATEAEAQRDIEVTLFGDQCEITFGGMYDPAWERKQ